MSTPPSTALIEKCDTCIFHPGNRMHLRRGRLEEMVRQTKADDSNVICHKSKSVSGDWSRDAWCAGSIAATGPGQMMRLTKGIGMLKVKTPDEMEREAADVRQ